MYTQHMLWFNSFQKTKIKLWHSEPLACADSQQLRQQRQKLTKTTLTTTVTVTKTLT